MVGVQVICARCEVEFLVCRSCWSGQRYCSKQCSSEARDESHRKSQTVYSRTSKGKASSRRRQRRYRLKKRKTKKNETDKATEKNKGSLKPESKRGLCLFCRGKIFVLVKRGKEKHFSFRRLRCLHQNSRLKS